MDTCTEQHFSYIGLFSTYLADEHPLFCSCPGQCTNAEDCQHQGGTLPMKFHKTYDRIQTGNLNMILWRDVQRILRLDCEQFKDFKKLVAGECKALEGRPTFYYLQENCVRNMICEIVQSVRRLSSDMPPRAKANPFWTTPLVEKEVYIEAVLIATVVDCLHHWLATRKKAWRNANEVSFSFVPGKLRLALDEIQDDMMPEYSSKDTISEVTKRPLQLIESKKSKTSYNPAKKVSQTVQISSSTQIHNKPQQASKATQTFDHKERFLARDSPSDNERVHVASNHRFQPQDNVEVLIAHKRDYDAQLDVLNEKQRKLYEAIDQKDRKIKELESSKLEDQLDIAELGVGLVLLRTVQQGNDDDLISKLSQTGIPQNTIARLVENPTFQRKFTCRKRKRISNGSSVEDREK